MTSTRGATVRVLGLALVLPGLTGCGLGTVGVLAALLGGGGGGSSTPGTEGYTITGLPPAGRLFTSDFETDLSPFTLVGGPAPFLSALGLPGSAMNAAGSALGSGEAVTKMLFRPVPGLSLTADVRLTTVGGASTQAWLGLRSQVAADGTPTLDAGVLLLGNSTVREFHVGGAVVHTDGLLDTSWHHYQINCRADGRVEFFVDGALVYLSSPVEILPQGPTPLPVTIGGRSSGGNALVDNLEVAGSPPTFAVSFMDGFAGSLAAYGLGPTTTALQPTISSSSGNPLPSLNPRGDASNNGEAVSTATYAYATGIEVRAEIEVTGVTTPACRAWVGLERGQSGSFTPDGVIDLLAGVHVTAQTDLITYVVNATTVSSEPNDQLFHAYRIVVRPDGFVEFFRDSLLKATSAVAVSSTFTAVPVSLGGRSATGSARVDNVSVSTPGAAAALRMTQIVPTGTAPAVRRFHSAIHDPRDDAIIVFGGFNGTTLYQDSFGLRFAGSTGAGQWITLSTTGTTPSARERHTAVYDGIRKRMLVFGGRDGFGATNSVSALNLTGSGFAWTSLSPGGSPPTGRQDHVAIFDETANRMIVFGGTVAAAPVSATWSLQFSATDANGVWTALTPTGAPSARAGCRAFWDAPRQRMLVFYGDDAGVSTNAAGTEIWALNLAGGGNGAWAQVTPVTVSTLAPGLAAVGRRSNTGVAGWAGERRVFVFGGFDRLGPNLHYPPAGTPNEAWLGELSGASAPTIAFVGAPDLQLPPRRDGHVLVWHPAGRRAILFGGVDFSSNNLNDTWELIVR